MKLTTIKLFLCRHDVNDKVSCAGKISEVGLFG